MQTTPPFSFAPQRSIRWALGLAASLALSLGASLAAAQSIEDHSLPKSAIKTWHAQCANGRLAKIRYDTRTEPTKMCVSVQDGSRPQSCTMVTQQQAPGHVKVLGEWVCQ